MQKRSVDLAVADSSDRTLTDLEATKLCAQAMGLRLLTAYPEGHILRTPRNHVDGLMVSRNGDHAYYFVDSGAYDPLHDDRQAMELVKRFNLHIIPGLRTPEGRAEWHVVDPCGEGCSKDLNRAIVECVAKVTAGTTQST